MDEQLIQDVLDTQAAANAEKTMKSYTSFMNQM